VISRAVTTHGSERLLKGLLARLSFVVIESGQILLEKHTRLN
jgi:hypothetical protein